MQIFAIVANYFLAVSVGIEIPFWSFFLIMPIIWVASMIPSMGGLGVREGAYVILFAGYAGAETAFALSILFFGLTVCASLIGGVCYLFAGKIPPLELEKMQEEDMRELGEKRVGEI